MDRTGKIVMTRSATGRRVEANLGRWEVENGLDESMHQGRQ